MDQPQPADADRLGDVLTLLEDDQRLAEVLDQLLVAAIAAGQSPREAQATIRSAQRKATQ